MKISLTYSSRSRFESPTVSTYLMTTVWVLALREKYSVQRRTLRKGREVDLRIEDTVGLNHVVHDIGLG